MADLSEALAEISGTMGLRCNDRRWPSVTSRRGFLGGAVGLGAGATLGTALPRARRWPRRAAAESRDDGHVPFEGEHQAGITNHSPANALIAAFDIVATDRPELDGHVARLTDGRAVAHAGRAGAEPRPAAPADGQPHPRPGSRARASLTVTVGVGASLFDDRFGLADRSRRSSGRWSTSRTTRSIPTRTHGDLLLQLCADEPDACVHALRILMRATRSTLVLRWMLAGLPAAEHARQGPHEAPATCSGSRTAPPTRRRPTTR